MSPERKSKSAKAPGKRRTPDAAAASEPGRRRALASFRLHDVPGYLIRRMQQRAVEIFDEEVGALGITPQQFAVLRAIEAQPGLSQIDVVAATGIDRSTLTELVGRMSERKLIKLERSGDDRRSNTLRLTNEGESLLLEALPRVIAAQERILAPIPRGRREALLKQLARLAGLTDEETTEELNEFDLSEEATPAAGARTRKPGG